MNLLLGNKSHHHSVDIGLYVLAVLFPKELNLLVWPEQQLAFFWLALRLDDKGYHLVIVAHQFHVA